MSAKDGVKRMLQPLKSWLQSETHTQLARNQLLLGKLASWQVRSRATIAALPEVEFKVTSQWGEDGIIDWLVERAQIPLRSQTFVEFGVETYREANTRFLLQNRNWRGLIMDGNPAMVQAVREDGLYWAHDLTVRPAFITRENINQLIADGGYRGEIGLLSVDVDGNDYWIWEAIDVVQPIVCVCEYNAVFGDVYPISVPYDAQFSRTRAHPSNLYFGASIAALRSLAARKGYRFAGSTSAANDAFFVREDYAGRVIDTAVERVEALPSFVRESRDAEGQLNYLTGLERLNNIAELPVVNVETGEKIRIGSLDSVYSPEWLAAMSHG